MNRQTAAAYRPIIIAIGRDIALNAVIPVACYHLSKAYISRSELTALLVASTFPILQSIHDLARYHEINPVAMLVLLGIVTSIGAVFVSGDPRVLLVRESLVTGSFGLACFVSLVLPRPIMFYFGRYFMAGSDPEKRRVFDEASKDPVVHRGHQLVTAVWGAVYVGEFLIRLILIYALAASVVLAVTPVVLGLTTILTIVWTFRYANKL